MLGGNYLYKKSQSTKVPAKIVMESNGVISILPFSKFFSIIGGSLEEVLVQNENSHEKKLLNGVDKSSLSAEALTMHKNQVASFVKAGLELALEEAHLTTQEKVFCKWGSVLPGSRNAT